MSIIKNISRFENRLAVLGIIGSTMFFFIVLLFLGNHLYAIIALLTLISLIIWIIKKNELRSYDKKKPILVDFIFYIFFAFSLLIVIFRPDDYEKPFFYHFILALLGSIIVYKSFFKRLNVYMTLFQIILIGISLQVTSSNIYPTVIGIDPHWHNMFSDFIISENSIKPNTPYSFLPSFHLIISFTRRMLNIGYKDASLVSISFLQIILNVLLIYIIGKLFTNKRLSISSSLLLIIANNHIAMSIVVIPNSIAASIVLILIYFIFYHRSKYRNLMILVFIVLLVITHTITALFFTLILLIIWYSTRNNIEKLVSIPILFFTVIYMVIWWIIAVKPFYSFIDAIAIGFRQERFISNPETVSNYLDSVSLIEQLSNNFGMFLFFSISFIGVLFLISKRKDERCLTFSIIAVTPLIIAFLALLGQRSIIIHRWYFFSQIMLSIPVAMGIYEISKIFNRRKLRKIVVIALIFVLSFFQIISPIANYDNFSFSPNTNVRYGLIDSEQSSLFFISTYGNHSIYADRYMEVFQFDGYNISSFDDELHSNDFRNITDEILLYRDEIQHHPIKIYGGPNRINYNFIDSMDINRFNRIFSSNDVQYYKR
jgi:hypothetical protein